MDVPALRALESCGGLDGLGKESGNDVDGTADGSLPVALAFAAAGVLFGTADTPVTTVAERAMSLATVRGVASPISFTAVMGSVASKAASGCREAE